MDFVFVIDEIGSLQPGHDSSVALMEAAQRRGHRVLVTTAAELGFADGRATAAPRPRHGRVPPRRPAAGGTARGTLDRRPPVVQPRPA